MHESYEAEIEVTPESKWRVLTAINSEKYADRIPTIPVFTKLKAKFWSK